MKAKLQKQFAYKYKHHYKHVIVIPEEAITELGWKGGQELELNVKDSQLIVETKKKTENGVESMSN